MKARELAEKLMENPDMDIIVDCFIYGCTYETFEIDDISVIDSKLIIECS